jgi:hypothetical protein
MKDGGKLIARVWLCWCCFLATGVSLWAQKGTINLGTVETDGGAKVYRLDFGRTDAVLTKHVGAAFRLHGAYAIMTPPDKGDFSFEFRSVGVWTCGIADFNRNAPTRTAA